jgi:catechol 2,3-dioxygenase-like lactoylglutathione lyase family enzyme
VRLYGVRIVVDDVAAARAFYVDTLGLPVAWEMADHGALGVGVGGAELIVEAVAPDGDDRDLVGRFVGVSLQVDDIAATHAELAAKGVAFDAPPEQQFWGGSLAHFKDPAGNTLTLLG